VYHETRELRALTVLEALGLTAGGFVFGGSRESLYPYVATRFANVAPARTPRPLAPLTGLHRRTAGPRNSPKRPNSSLPLENQRTSAKKSFDWKMLGRNGLRKSGRRT